MHRFHHRSTRALLVVGLVSLVANLGGVAELPATAEEAQAADGRRLVAVGDVHGAVEELRALLREVGLMNAAGDWSGGDDVLVQTGDFMDRGTGVREVMELLIRLQGEARAVGGRVVVLLGNHEVMNLVGALQYVAPESLAAFAGRDAEARRREAFREYERRVLRRDPAWKRADSRVRRQVESEWLEARPPGWVEFLEALGPEGSFGRWLRSLPAVHREGEYLFLHAGIPPDLPGWSVERINERIHAEIETVDRYREHLQRENRLPAVSDLQDLLAAADGYVGGLIELAERVPDDRPPPLPSDPASIRDVEPDAFYAPLALLDDWFLFAPEGPMWFRGYARWDFFEVAERLPPILERLGAVAVFVGHTPQPSGIRVRGDGALYLIDTGMLTEVYEGRGEALVLVDGGAQAVTSSGVRRNLPAPRPLGSDAVSPAR